MSTIDVAGITVYKVDLPEGIHYAPKYLKMIRNATPADNKRQLQTRIVRCHPMSFEGDGAPKRKYLAPILWAHLAGEMVICAVAIESAQGTAIARTYMTPAQYYASPLAEIETL